MPTVVPLCIPSASSATVCETSDEEGSSAAPRPLPSYKLHGDALHSSAYQRPRLHSHGAISSPRYQEMHRRVVELAGTQQRLEAQMRMLDAQSLALADGKSSHEGDVESVVNASMQAALGAVEQQRDKLLDRLCSVQLAASQYSDILRGVSPAPDDGTWEKLTSTYQQLMSGDVDSLAPEQVLSMAQQAWAVQQEASDDLKDKVESLRKELESSQQQRDQLQQRLKDHEHMLMKIHTQCDVLRTVMSTSPRQEGEDHVPPPSTTRPSGTGSTVQDLRSGKQLSTCEEVVSIKDSPSKGNVGQWEPRSPVLITKEMVGEHVDELLSERSSFWAGAARELRRVNSTASTMSLEHASLRRAISEGNGWLKWGLSGSGRHTALEETSGVSHDANSGAESASRGAESAAGGAESAAVHAARDWSRGASTSRSAPGGGAESAGEDSTWEWSRRASASRRQHSGQFRLPSGARISFESTSTDSDTHAADGVDDVVEYFNRWRATAWGAMGETGIHVHQHMTGDHVHADVAPAEADVSTYQRKVDTGVQVDFDALTVSPHGMDAVLRVLAGAAEAVEHLEHVDKDKGDADQADVVSGSSLEPSISVGVLGGAVGAAKGECDVGSRNGDGGQPAPTMQPNERDQIARRMVINTTAQTDIDPDGPLLGRQVWSPMRIPSIWFQKEKEPIAAERASAPLRTSKSTSWLDQLGRAVNGDQLQGQYRRHMQLVQLKELHAKQVLQLSSRHEEAMRQVLSQHKAAVENLVKAHHRDLRGSAPSSPSTSPREPQDSKLSNLRKRHEEAMRQLTREHHAKMDAMHKRHYATLRQLLSVLSVLRDGAANPAAGAGERGGFASAATSEYAEQRRSDDSAGESAHVSTGLMHNSVPGVADKAGAVSIAIQTDAAAGVAEQDGLDDFANPVASVRVLPLAKNVTRKVFTEQAQSCHNTVEVLAGDERQDETSRVPTVSQNPAHHSNGTADTMHSSTITKGVNETVGIIPPSMRNAEQLNISATGVSEEGLGGCAELSPSPFALTAHHPFSYGVDHTVGAAGAHVSDMGGHPAECPAQTPAVTTAGGVSGASAAGSAANAAAQDAHAAQDAAFSVATGLTDDTAITPSITHVADTHSADVTATHSAGVCHGNAIGTDAADVVNTKVSGTSTTTESAPQEAEQTGCTAAAAAAAAATVSMVSSASRDADVCKAPRNAFPLKSSAVPVRSVASRGIAGVSSSETHDSQRAREQMEGGVGEGDQAAFLAPVERLLQQILPDVSSGGKTDELQQQLHAAIAADLQHLQKDYVEALKEREQAYWHLLMDLKRLREMDADGYPEDPTGLDFPTQRAAHGLSTASAPMVQTLNTGDMMQMAGLGAGARRTGDGLAVADEFPFTGSIFSELLSTLLISPQLAKERNSLDRSSHDLFSPTTSTTASSDDTSDVISLPVPPSFAPSWDLPMTPGPSSSYYPRHNLPRPAAGLPPSHSAPPVPGARPRRLPAPSQVAGHLSGAPAATLMGVHALAGLSRTPREELVNRQPVRRRLLMKSPRSRSDSPGLGRSALAAAGQALAGTIVG